MGLPAVRLAMLIGNLGRIGLRFLQGDHIGVRFGEPAPVRLGGDGAEPVDVPGDKANKRHVFSSGKKVRHKPSYKRFAAKRKVGAIAISEHKISKDVRL